MSAAVIPLADQASVDQAWADYQALVDQAIHDQRLFADRLHIEAMAKAHARFTQLFLAGERTSNNVIPFARRRA